MAEKNVYYFKARLYDSAGNVEYSYKTIPSIVKKILDSPATKTNKNVKILDITPPSEKLHSTLDVYKYQYDHLFLRASKQKPKSSTIVRDYSSGMAAPILPGINESMKGIENYTYIYMDYTSCILSVVQAQGAPDEKALSAAFDLYSNGYSLVLEPIPNTDSIQMLYQKKHAELSKISVCIPTADPVILEELLGKKGKRLFEEYPADNFQINISINTKVKRGKITNNSEDSHILLDCLNENLGLFSKATVDANCDGERARRYDFYDSIFKFPINVNISHKVNKMDVYYTSDELVDIFYEQLKIAFNSSRNYVILIANRNQKE